MECLCSINRNEGDWHKLLIEEQIKSVNPYYWKLAVLYEPSEEEVKNNE
ncbi:hypothetical protein B835_2041 [Enterococcus mundtii 3F]|nr:hypothetical protein [Enterococcus mundtii 3F]